MNYVTSTPLLLGEIINSRSTVQTVAVVLPLKSLLLLEIQLSSVVPS